MEGGYLYRWHEAQLVCRHLACRDCLVSTVPLADSQTKMHREAQKSIPKWVSQELCCITSVGINGGVGWGVSKRANSPGRNSSILFNSAAIVQGLVHPSLAHTTITVWTLRADCIPKASVSGNNTLLTWLPM